MRTFRVDRMDRVDLTTREREGREILEKVDIPALSKSTFGMFSGKEEKVEMVFHNKMMDAVIDKFGSDVWITKVDEWHFKITEPVAVSPQFFAWIFGLEGYATITGPSHVVEQMKKMLAKASEYYQ